MINQDHNHEEFKDLIKTIREQIRNARKAKGLTQAELANIVKISSNFVGLVERGARTPSFKTMSKIASALGLNLKELVGEIKAVPEGNDIMIEKIVSCLKGCTPREKKLIYGFIRVLAKERTG
ncbi:MAG: helix-turn-helix transcriptional regulator [Candidatus Ratteibacteria bacterium]|jgi:ribosome-binding protein aMBF1 (putative translation factor)